MEDAEPTPQPAPTGEEPQPSDVGTEEVDIDAEGTTPPALTPLEPEASYTNLNKLNFETIMNSVKTNMYATKPEASAQAHQPSGGHKETRVKRIEYAFASKLGSRTLREDRHGYGAFCIRQAAQDYMDLCEAYTPLILQSTAGSRKSGSGSASASTNAELQRILSLHEKYQQLIHQRWLLAASIAGEWTASIGSVVAKLATAAEEAIIRSFPSIGVFPVNDVRSATFTGTSSSPTFYEKLVRSRAAFAPEQVAGQLTPAFHLAVEDSRRPVGVKSIFVDGFIVTLWDTRLMAARYAITSNASLIHVSSGLGTPVHAPWTVSASYSGLHFTVSSAVPFMAIVGDKLSLQKQEEEPPTEKASPSHKSSHHRKEKGETSQAAAEPSGKTTAEVDPLTSMSGKEGVEAFLRSNGVAATLKFPDGSKSRTAGNTSNNPLLSSEINMKEEIVCGIGMDGRFYIVNADGALRQPMLELTENKKDDLTDSVRYNTRAFAARLDRGSLRDDFATDMHSAGVPLRHLLLVYMECTTDRGKKAVLTELCGRVLVDVFNWFIVPAAEYLGKGEFVLSPLDNFPKIMVEDTVERTMKILLQIVMSGREGPTFVRRVLLPLVFERFGIPTDPYEGIEGTKGATISPQKISNSMANSIDRETVFGVLMRKILSANATSSEAYGDPIVQWRTDFGKLIEHNWSSATVMEHVKNDERFFTQTFGHLFPQSTNHIQFCPMRHWLVLVLREGQYTSAMIPFSAGKDKTVDVLSEIQHNAIDVWIVMRYLSHCAYSMNTPAAGPIVGVGALHRKQQETAHYCTIVLEVMVSFMRFFGPDISMNQLFVGYYVPLLMRLQGALDNMNPVIVDDLPLRYADIISTLQTKQGTNPTAIQQKENFNMSLVTSGKVKDGMKKQAELVRWVLVSLVLDESTSSQDANSTLIRDAVLTNYFIFAGLWMASAHAEFFQREVDLMRRTILQRTIQLQKCIRGYDSRKECGLYWNHQKWCFRAALKVSNLSRTISTSLHTLQRVGRGLVLRYQACIDNERRHHYEAMLLLGTMCQRMGKGLSTRKQLYDDRALNRLQRCGRAYISRHENYIFRAKSLLLRVQRGYSVRCLNVFVNWRRNLWDKRAFFLQRYAKCYKERRVTGILRSVVLKERRCAALINRVGRSFILRRRFYSCLVRIAAVVSAYNVRKRLHFQNRARLAHEEKQAFEKLLKGSGWATYHALLQQNKELTKEIEELNFLLDRELSFRKMQQVSSISSLFGHQPQRKGSPRKQQTDEEALLSPKFRPPVSMSTRMIARAQHVLLLSPLFKKEGGPSAAEQSSLENDVTIDISPSPTTRTASMYDLANVLKGESNLPKRRGKLSVRKKENNQKSSISAMTSNLGLVSPPQNRSSSLNHDENASDREDDAPPPSLLSEDDSTRNNMVIPLEVLSTGEPGQQAEPTVQDLCDELEHRNIRVKSKNEALLVLARISLQEAHKAGDMKVRLVQIDEKLKSLRTENDSLSTMNSCQKESLTATNQMDAQGSDDNRRHRKFLKDTAFQIKQLEEKKAGDILMTEALTNREKNLQHKLDLIAVHDIGEGASVPLVKELIREADKLIADLKFLIQNEKKAKERHEFLQRCKQLVAKEPTPGQGHQSVMEAPKDRMLSPPVAHTVSYLPPRSKTTGQEKGKAARNLDPLKPPPRKR